MKAQKALEAYDELRMKSGDDYLTFKNDFVRLAGECGKPRASWKHEFNRRLTDTLQRALAGAFIDDAVAFDHFVRLGMQHAMINKRISDRQAAGRQATVSQTPARGSRGGRTARGSRTIGQTANGPDPAANPDKKLTPEEVRLLYQQGRCFICREHGHTSRDCPKKSQQQRTADADREARLRALEERWATPSEDRSPAPSSRVRFEDVTESEN
jgi:hypothetical protein